MLEMRIILTSDLHYDVQRSKAPTDEIARKIVAAGGDLLVLVGDSAAVDLAILERLLSLFDAFNGRRLFVAGNHELWVAPGADSFRRWEVELADVCKRAGYHYLDALPFVESGLAIVGSVGWYDYTFRSASLRIPLRFYQHKVAPGRAAAEESLRHLVTGYDDIPPGADGIFVRWMDGVRANLGMSDVEYTHLLAARLRTHLVEATARVDRVVAAIHHVPFHQLVPRTMHPNFAFAEAYMGSELLGEVLLDFPQVRDVYCGHAHRRKTVRVGGLTATCIGSTYTEKLYDVLDVP